jgi:hypothetical protein
MKQFLSPLALAGAVAFAVAACSNEGPVSPLSPRSLSLGIGTAAAGQAQVCLSSTSPATLTYSVALSYSGQTSGDNQLSSPQAITPGACITPIVKNGADVGPVYPQAFVLSTITVNEAGGTWTYSCVVAPAGELPFCPNPANGSGNSATTGASVPHGSTITYDYVSPPPVIHVDGCSYSQGYYKTHLSYTTSTLAAGGTFIVGGKLDVSGGLDRSLGTTGDNSLTAAQIVNNLNPKNAEAAMRQLIAAELNVARGATTTAGVDAAITGLRNYYAGTSATKTQVGAWTTTLDNFNNGLIVGAAPHCGSETTV